jgi:ubiquinol-cytochrome c reductase cytochrome c subunit
MARDVHLSGRSIALTLALAAASALSLAPAAPAQEPPATDARTLYLRHCGVCHGPQAEGTRRAPSLVGVGAAAAHFQMSTGRMPPAPGDRGPRRTPPVEFSDEGIMALSRYIGRIAGGPPIPQVDVAGTDPSRGALLYLQSCAACHGSSGAGSVLTGGDMAPALEHLGPVEIAEAMITGPGEMPVFAGVFDRDDRDAIVRYVGELQELDNRGGAPLGHLGPGAEAMVALLVGLPLLLFGARRLGRSARERRPPDAGDDTAGAT